MTFTKHIGVVFAVILASVGASAGTQSVTANVSFDVPLTVTKDADISFGTLKAATSGTYVLAPNGTITPSNGGVVVGGSPAFGKITISGSATQTISITTGAYTANAGVRASAATCVYDGMMISSCDTGTSGLAAPGVSGKALLLGLTIDTDGTQAAGTTAAPTFVVAVIYG